MRPVVEQSDMFFRHALSSSTPAPGPLEKFDIQGAQSYQISDQMIKIFSALRVSKTCVIGKKKKIVAHFAMISASPSSTSSD